MWDPAQYLRFGDDRSRPFFDLVARVGAAAPSSVIDLGCGPGTLTATLLERWPDAHVVGVDSSPAMIEAAAPLAGAHLEFVLGDVASWTPPGPVDVVVTNALLQWVPGHEQLLGAIAGWLRPDGWLAVQVPGNFTSPSHVAIADLAASPHWRDRIGDRVQRAASLDPVRYATLLLDAGLEVDAWETTYVHVLQGEDPVLEWVRGTALRPILSTLPQPEAEEFCAELAGILRAAYPPTAHGTPFPFRRVFAVGHRRA